ncbi:hypothetical protein NHX12_021483, partial [Muraenolepis orangiensis]
IPGINQENILVWPLDCGDGVRETAASCSNRLELIPQSYSPPANKPPNNATICPGEGRGKGTGERDGGEGRGRGTGERDGGEGRGERDGGEGGTGGEGRGRETGERDGGRETGERDGGEGRGRDGGEGGRRQAEMAGL